MSLLRVACGCEADAAPAFRDGVVVVKTAPGAECHAVGDFISSAQLASCLYGGAELSEEEA